MEKENNTFQISPYEKIVEMPRAIDIVHEKQKLGMCVVLTTGIYDLVHYKHAESLAYTSTFGDFLVIGIPDDNTIINAATTHKQDKDIYGPIIDYDKRAKLIAHLPYVDLIFRKTTSKINLIEEIKPNILVQSVTSGPEVVEEVLNLQNSFPAEAQGKNLAINLGDIICQLIFVDDVVDGIMKIIPYSNAVESALDWEKHKFSENKFHGSLIKKRILERETNKQK